MRTVLVHAFKSKDCIGSPQYLHFFESEELRLKSLENFKVQDEFDHSFIYVQGNSARVSWKNKVGVFQLCGSGAYALSWFLFQKENHLSILLKTDHLELNASIRDNKVYLNLPSFPIETEKQGIHFFELENQETLLAVNWQDYSKKVAGQEIHGLCLFHWDKMNKKGYLRYFTPWHGREEDHVTGSIHQYLTPLIDKLYGEKHQHWTQLSVLGGGLESEFQEGGVSLYGICEVVNLYQN